MICKASDCNKEVPKGSHNRVFCCSECRRVAQAEAAKKKHKKKKVKRKKKEFCKCGVKISMYNNSNSCFACQSNETNQRVVETARKINSLLQ